MLRHTGGIDLRPCCETLEQRLLLSADAVVADVVCGPVPPPDEQVAVTAEVEPSAGEAVIVPAEVIRTLGEAVTAALQDGRAVVEVDGAAFTCRAISATTFSIAPAAPDTAEAVPFRHRDESRVAVDAPEDVTAGPHGTAPLDAAAAGAPQRRRAIQVEEADPAGGRAAAEKPPVERPATKRAVAPAVVDVDSFQLTVPVSLTRVLAATRPSDAAGRPRRAEEMTLGEILAVLNDRPEAPEVDGGPVLDAGALAAAAHRRRARAAVGTDADDGGASAPVPFVPPPPEAPGADEADRRRAAADDMVVDVIVLAALLQGVRDRAAAFGAGGTTAALEAAGPLRILQRDVPTVATAAGTLPAERPAVWI